MIKLIDILNEMYPPYKANMVQKVRYKASDIFTNDPKLAVKKGYLEQSISEQEPQKGTGKKYKKVAKQSLNKVKETSDPQSGNAAPYGSGYAPIK